jgi:hypothetical protein
MAQLKHVVEPFGEVNVYPASGGKVRVTATILMEARREGTQTGLALDGSGSMSDWYGVSGGGMLSSVFGGANKKKPNLVEPVARAVSAYLARKLDSDGGTTCIYWAVGPQGGQVEVIGDLTADQAERHSFGPPRQFGTGTRLLPAVKYFCERFADAPWGFYAFVTDGELHDLEEVKAYSTRLAREVAAGKRRPVKFVLIGVGDSVNEQQMEELDDLDTGTSIDLWDHKLAAELRQLEQIFAEVVDRNARVADRGKILDPQGRTLKDFSDTGVTAVFQFEAPAGTAYFTLEANGSRIHQPLSDTAVAPPSEIAGGATASAEEFPEVVEALPVEEAQAAEAAAPPAEDPYPEIKLEWDKDKFPGGRP